MFLFLPGPSAVATIIAVSVALFILLVCLHELYARYLARRLPPGVSGLRAFFELPNDSEKPWLKMLALNQRYGDIASGSLFGYNIILVNSPKIASDLLDKRGINYSDRPRSVMGGEMSGCDKMMVLRQYDERLRAQRKYLTQDVGNPVTVGKLHEMIQFETRRSLQNVLHEPHRILAHIRKNFTSISLRISHGYVTHEGNDPLVDLAELSNSQVFKKIIPGAHFADFVPFLKYVPSWVPGVSFIKTAKANAVASNKLVDIPHDYVMSQLAAGTALPSFSSRNLDAPGLTKEQEDRIKWTASTILRGGTETAISLVYGFYLAMTLHPQVMRKAQQELDSVVGSGRLPTHTDRSSLPYMEALFTELLRWNVTIPITLRRARSEDEYNGYLIPAGSYVLVNIWAILHDERMYTDPFEFKPERFLGDNPEPDPSNVVFGFGRRRCPGYSLTYSTAWLMCVQSLAVLNISKHIENGVEITPEMEQEGGMIIEQVPFKCAIKPRSVAAEQLVKEEFSL